ncbi:TPA: hypothetical protein DEA21_03160 [Candidatus Uhrbacteria bacterium]|nr:hypothetical protein [Candidatus Uhrbacteria bacterium]
MKGTTVAAILATIASLACVFAMQDHEATFNVHLSPSWTGFTLFVVLSVVIALVSVSVYAHRQTNRANSLDQTLNDLRSRLIQVFVQAEIDEVVEVGDLDGETHLELKASWRTSLHNTFAELRELRAGDTTTQVELTDLRTRVEAAEAIVSRIVEFYDGLCPGEVERSPSEKLNIVIEAVMGAEVELQRDDELLSKFDVLHARVLSMTRCALHGSSAI